MRQQDTLSFDDDSFAEKVGGEMGLRICLPGAAEQLGISQRQLHEFYEATPNGDALWNDYLAQRDAIGARRNYCFVDYIEAVLTKAHVPLVKV